MKDRIKQLLIVGGIFQPFLLGFEYIDVLFKLFRINFTNLTIISWAVWIVYLIFLLSSVMSFIFPMRKYNKVLSRKYPKTFLFLFCIGWVPYVSIPLNFLVSYFDDGLPNEWFDFVLSYLSFYEFCINCSFLVAAILIMRKVYIEYRVKHAKKRYKNIY